MKTRSLVLLALVLPSSMLAAGLAASSPARPIPRPAGMERRKVDDALRNASAPVPMPLSTSNRLARLRKLIDPDQQDVLANLPQQLEMRLVPAKPELENTGHIAHVSGADYRAPKADAPGGIYWMSGKATDWYYLTPDADSNVTIGVPTEVGALYVFDCRALQYDYWFEGDEPYSQASVQVAFDGSNTKQTVKTVEGHAFAVHKATKTRTRFELSWKDSDPTAYRALAFWGCDIGKAG